MSRITIFTTTALTAMCGVAQSSPLKSKPNIVVIVADDFGYGIINAYDCGAKGAYAGLTPNLDQLASEGIRFTDGYVTASTSGPSRAALLTGRHQQRMGIYANVDTQRTHCGVPTNEVMFPVHMKQAGYTSAIIGKWHAGRDSVQLPIPRGFDEFYGFSSAQTNYFDAEGLAREGIKPWRKSMPIYEGEKVVTKHDYLTYEFTDRAVSFIERNKENPFCLYLAYNAVHGPYQVPSDQMAKFEHLAEERGDYEPVRAAMVHTLDEGIGKVLNALKENGLNENTLVVFLSDNGGLGDWWEGSNGELRGVKRQRWDGGIRVAYMMKWDGVIDPGQVRGEVVSSLDIAPTALALAGVDANKIVLDGEDLSPLFKKSKDDKPIHDAIYWAGGDVFWTGRTALKAPEGVKDDNPPPAWAVRTDRWKLVEFMHPDAARTSLFDMRNSVSESDADDVADKHPEVVAKLRKQFVAWFDEVNSKPQAWSSNYYRMLKGVKK